MSLLGLCDVQKALHLLALALQHHQGKSRFRQGCRRPSREYLAV